MATSPSALLNTVEAVSTVVSRLLPVIEHVPDSFGKWVPPIKAAVAANAKLAASIGLAGAASKSLRGRLSAVDAVMVGFNAHALTGKKSLGTLGAVGAIAVSKLVRHFKDANAEARRLKTEAGALDRQLGKTAKGSSKGAGGGVNPLARIVATVGVYRLVANAFDDLKGAFDLGGDLSDGVAKTGILAAELLVLRQAGKDAGVEDVAGGVNKLQDALVSAVKDGAGPAALALGNLGLSAKELVNQSPVDQLQAVGAALREIKSPALKTSISRDLFGKAGTDLLPLLENANALDEAQRAIGKQASILGENAAAFDAVSDRLNRSGLKMQGFFVGLAATVLPMVEAATARLDATDLAEKGQAFGVEIRKAVDFFAGAFADPAAFLSIFEDNLIGSFLNALNLLANKLVEASAIFVSALLDGVDVLVRAMSAGLQMAVDKILDKVPGFGKSAGGDFASYYAKQAPTGISAVANSLGNASKSPFVDFFGAQSHFERAAASKARLGNRGAELVDTYIAGSGAQPGRAPVKSRFGEKLSSFATFADPLLQSSSRLRGASNAGSLIASGSGMFDFSGVANLSTARRATPLLSAAERASFEDAKVAAGGQRSASTAGAFGVVRAGDAARRKNAEKEKERERLANENSVQRSNELLGGIHDYARRTAEALE